MKLLLILLAMLAGVLWWRGSRRGAPAAESRPRAAAPPPEDMARCPVCGLHLPRVDALPGRRGLYCGAEHRRQAEG